MLISVWARFLTLLCGNRVPAGPERGLNNSPIQNLQRLVRLLQSDASWLHPIEIALRASVLYFCRILKRYRTDLWMQGEAFVPALSGNKRGMIAKRKSFPPLPPTWQLIWLILGSQSMGNRSFQGNKGGSITCPMKHLILSKRWCKAKTITDRTACRLGLSREQW